MAVVLIPATYGQYQALSTDISGNKISGVSLVGADVWISDTNQWFRVLSDLTLAPIYASASIVSVDSSTPVNIASANPVVDASYNGQIIISGSNTPVSGSTLSATNRNGFLFKSHPNNTGIVWLWNNASGSQTSGFPLSNSESFMYTGSALSGLNYGVSGATSACLCWIKV